MATENVDIGEGVSDRPLTREVATRVMSIRAGCWIVLAVFVSTFIACGDRRAIQKTYRIGVLIGLDYFFETFVGFRSEMNRLGYVEGKNVVYDVRRTNVDPDKEREYVSEFVRAAVDLILTSPTEVSLLAKEVIGASQIPQVFANALVEDMDLIDSIPSPGGNLTGVRYPGIDLALKRFETLIELIPDGHTVLAPYERGYPIVEGQLGPLREMAKEAGIQLIELPVSDVEELSRHFEPDSTLRGLQIDGILMIIEPLCVKNDAFRILATFARDRGIVMGGSIMEVDGMKSIFGVAADGVAVGRQAARIVDEILRGVPAGSIPVVSAEAMLRIEYGAASDMGIRIPEGLLSRADAIGR